MTGDARRSGGERPRVAVFRPDDDRLHRALDALGSLGCDVIADPLLAVEPTDATPRTDADVVVFTSVTGVRCIPDGWDPGAATVAAIGPRTAEALRNAGLPVDLVPGTYSSRGLVEALADRAEGGRVEIARSDHGSEDLLRGLDGAGAYHHETVLYRLGRPGGSGDSTALAADDGLDAALFTSSLTVEHFLAAAEERGIREAAVAGLGDAVVGAIGDPTRRTAEAAGIHVDVVPEEATFEALARAAVDRLG